MGEEKGGLKVSTHTSVLSLSAAITPNHKHSRVQICLCLERLPTEMFPDHGFFNVSTRGNSLSPHSDSEVCQGHTNTSNRSTYM